MVALPAFSATTGPANTGCNDCHFAGTVASNPSDVIFPGVEMDILVASNQQLEASKGMLVGNKKTVIFSKGSKIICANAQVKTMGTVSGQADEGLIRTAKKKFEKRG
ncbi:hypothetical protein KKC45_03270 [Patescibacteria group bacterium]|nr:hypothetical protein [Patescibacteria group bacterium]